MCINFEQVIFQKIMKVHSKGITPKWWENFHLEKATSVCYIVTTRVEEKNRESSKSNRTVLEYMHKWGYKIISNRIWKRFEVQKFFVLEYLRWIWFCIIYLIINAIYITGAGDLNKNNKSIITRVHLVRYVIEFYQNQYKI